MSDRTRAAGDAAALSSAPSASTGLHDLADAFWEEHLRTHPIWATILGDRRYDDRLPDWSPTATRAREADLAATVAAGNTLDPEALTPTERITRQLLIDEAGGQLGALKTGIHEWDVNQLDGPLVSLLNLPEYQTIAQPADGDRLIARWRRIGAYLDEAIAGLRRAKAAGRVAVRTPVDRTIDELRDLEALPPGRWKLAAPADDRHDGWTAGEEAAFGEGLRAAVREVAAPAFRRYSEVLEEEIRPAARPDERPGLMHLPGGAEAYRAMIRSHTSLDLDPADVHATGLAQIEEIDAQFVALGRRLLATADLPATLNALRTDRSLRFETADEVFRTAQVSLERAAAAIPGWFGRLPKAACEVVRVPEHAEAHQTIAYYAWPALDGSRPGRYYINLYAPETRPRYEAEALAFHESIPGHHLQIAIAQELDGLPAFQRALGSTAFSEGWGLYTERLAEEMGLYSGEFDRFGILSFDAWRAGRLVVDTGMHALGWTRQQAIDFLSITPPSATTTSRTRSTATSCCPPRRCPTRSARSRSCGSAPRPSAAWVPASISAPSTTPCSDPARSASPPSATSSSHGSLAWRSRPADGVWPVCDPPISGRRRAPGSGPVSRAPP